MQHPVSLDQRFCLIRRIDKSINDIGVFSEGLALFHNAHSRCGYIDSFGEVRIQPRYKDATAFQNGIACVEDDTGWFLISTDGERISSDCYREMPLIREGIILFERQGLFGFKTVAGDVITDACFDKAFPFHNGYAAVELNGKTGLIDTSGRMIIQPTYGPLSGFRSGLFTFSEGVAAVCADGRYGYIDEADEFVIPPVFTDATLFRDGIATVATADGKTAIDRKGNTLFPPSEADIGLFFGGLAGFSPTHSHEYEGVIRKDGSLVLNRNTTVDHNTHRFRYKHHDFSHGLIPFTQNGLWGFITREGNEVIAPVYDDVDDLGRNGFTSVEKNGLWGLLDKEGSLLVDCLYLHPIDYNGGDRLVMVDDEFTLIYGTTN